MCGWSLLSPKGKPEEEFVTPIDAAELLKLTPGTIRQLMLRGEIPDAEGSRRYLAD